MNHLAPRRFLLLWIITGFAVLLAACAAFTSTPPAPREASTTPPPNVSPPPKPPEAPPIFAFSTVQNDQLQIHLARADGTYLQQLTTQGNSNTCPAFSPDGKRIAFCSNRGGKDELYLMNRDGSDQRRLTDAISGCSCTFESPLVWSPDGQWIGLLAPGEGSKDPGMNDLFAVRADGSAALNLTGAPQRFTGWTWDTNSQSILFGGQRDGKQDIYRVSLASRQVAPLATRPQSMPSASTPEGSQPITAAPAGWSPDGKLLLYVAGGQGWADIYALPDSGGQAAALTSNSAVNLYPQWFPDGQRILFSSSRTGDHDLYVMNKDGSAQTNLTQNPGVLDAWATISKDGKRIIYMTMLNNQWDCWVMNADGSGKQKLTPVTGVPRSVSWSP